VRKYLDSARWSLLRLREYAEDPGYVETRYRTAWVNLWERDMARLELMSASRPLGVFTPGEEEHYRYTLGLVAGLRGRIRAIRVLPPKRGLAAAPWDAFVIRLASCPAPAAADRRVQLALVFIHADLTGHVPLA
jgi:hypothetical protein